MGRRLKIAALVAGGIVFALLVASGVFFATLSLWGDGPRAEQALLKGNYVAAFDGYDRALASRLLPRNSRVQFLVGRGTAQLGLNHPDQALADYNAALALDPTARRALHMRGIVLMKQQNCAKAISDFSAILERAPNDYWALLRRAQCRESILDVDGAIADFGALTRLMPNMDVAYLRVAYNYARKHDDAKAIAALDGWPMTQAYDAEAYVNRGSGYDTVGAYARAIAEYDNALRIQPDDASAYRERGMAWITAGNYPSAIADLDKSAALDSSDASAYYNRGFAKILAGRYREAISDFTHTLELNPTDAYAVIWLHLAQRRTGNDDGADLARYSDRLDRGEWPMPVVEYFRSKIDAATLRTAAEQEKVPSRRQEKSCEAEYYISALDVAEGKTATALPLIHRAVDMCPPGFVELIAARADLKRLGE